MFANHPAARALRNLGAFDKPKTQAQLDAVATEKQALLDATANAAGQFAADSIRDEAIAMVQGWAATQPSDLDEGETLADRLEAMAIGVADENQDGDITEDEADIVDVALNAMLDYMVAQGVSEDDAIALLADKDGDAADRVHELLAGSEDGDQALDSFVFDADSSEAVMDGVLDAVYKKKIVIRQGKKMRVNKRVSGHVRLSAGQKVAIRKAGMKSRSAGARVRRMKSMKIRNRAGL